MNVAESTLLQKTHDAVITLVAEFKDVKKDVQENREAIFGTASGWGLKAYVKVLLWGCGTVAVAAMGALGTVVVKAMGAE